MRTQSVLTAAVVLVGFLVAAFLTVGERNRPEAHSRGGFLPGNPGRGSELFFERGCAECHAVAGVGGVEAPDLARSGRAPSDLLEIAGAMWNHAPKMWEKMTSRDYSVPALTPRDFIDLMAFLYVAGYLEEEGDPVRGEAIFASKRCSDCHATGESEPKTGPNLARGSSSLGPIRWVRLLWEHAPTMEKAVRDRNLPWPQISPPETVDLLAFLKSIGTNSVSAVPLPGDPWVGKYLFRRHCRVCHRAEGEGSDVGPDLGASSATRTLSGLTSSLWNHVPDMDERMEELDVERPSFSEQEMADLITYLFAIRYVEAPGDRVVGAKVYSRSCSPCHGESGGGDEGPNLRSLGARVGPAFMAATLWNHGPGMYEQMKEHGLEWPLLQDNEMRDLVEFLRSLQPDT